MNLLGLYNAKPSKQQHQKNSSKVVNKKLDTLIEQSAILIYYSALMSDINLT